MQSCGCGLPGSGGGNALGQRGIERGTQGDRDRERGFVAMDDVGHKQGWDMVRLCRCHFLLQGLQAGCAVLAQYAAGPERPAFLHVKFGVRSGQHICLPEKGAVELDELIDFFLQRHVIEQFSEFPVFHCAGLPLYTGAFDVLIIHAPGQRGKKQIAEHRTGSTGKAGPKAGRGGGKRVLSSASRERLIS